MSFLIFEWHFKVGTGTRNCKSAAAPGKDSNFSMTNNINQIVET